MRRKAVFSIEARTKICMARDFQKNGGFVAKRNL
jgi:hypothetical protein